MGIFSGSGGWGNAVYLGKKAKAGHRSDKTKIAKRVSRKPWQTKLKKKKPPREKNFIKAWESS